MLHLWKDEEVKKTLLENGWASIADQLSTAVVVECLDNQGKIGRKVRSFSQSIFKVWRSGLQCTVTRKSPGEC